MKKIYTLLASALLIACVAFGQSKFGKITPVFTPMNRGPVQMTPAAQGTSTGGQFVLKAPPLYSENFEGVTPPALPAGMTTGGNTGSDFFKTGTNVEANTGGYWPVPAHTKFAMTNDDVCNCDKGADYLELPQLDFTGKTGMSMSFAAVDDGTYGGGPAEVQININNAGWTTIHTMDQAPGVAWQNLTVSLTGSDNQSNVKIRFFYNDQTQWGTGFAVDDIVIDLPASYDLSLNQKYFYGYQDSTATKYYTQIPQKQSQKDTLIFGGAFKNKGGTTQNNVILNVNVTGAQTYSATSTGKAVAAGANDSANVNSPYYVASAKGSHNIEFTVTGDSTDALLADNTLRDTIVVTDSVYARDNNMPFSGGWYGGPGETYIMGNSFYFGDADSATSLSVYIGAFTGLYDQLGNTMNFQLYELDVNGDWILMASKDFYDITASDKGKWLTFPLTPVAPYTSTSLQAGGLYLAAFEGLSDTTLFTTGTGAPGAPPLTTFVNIAGTWYYAQSIPFIRLNTKYACSATVSSTNTNVSCNGGNDGAINLTLSGAQGPFTYSWSNGATTEDLTGLAPGSYTVTITFGGTCSVTGGPYSITQPQALAAATSATGTCSGSTNGTATATPSGGTAPYSYLWSNGQTGQTANNLAAGSYTVTVTDSKNCTTTGSATVVAVTVAATAAATNTSCGLNNGSALASATGGTSPYTYLWSNAQTTASITGLAAGTYTVTITDNATCTGTATATISASSGVTVSTSSTNAACGASDGTATVDSPTGTAYTYLWSNGQTTAQATALGAGTYSVTVTDTVGGCSGTATASVNNTGAATLSAAETDVTCNGASTGAVNITVTGGTSPLTYLWNNGATTEDVTGLAAGTYIITVTGNDGCASTSTSVISEPAAITSSVAATNASCNGGTDGSVNLLASGGTGTLTYLWSNGATTEDISGVGAGTYTVVIMDANSCADTASATVAEPSAINLSYAVTDAVGNTGAVNLTATGGTGSLSYLWSNGATTEDISGLAPGTYSVTVTDANSCQSDTSATVLSTGISEEKVNTSFSVFPNPNRGVFNVQFNNGKGQYSLMLRNVIGQVIYSERVVINGNASRHIDLSNIGQGIYFLTVSGDDVSRTQKVTIK